MSATVHTPPSPSSLIDRHAELARILDAVTRGERLVVVRGPPGVGKSWLGRHVATALRGGGRRVVAVRVLNGDERAATLRVIAESAGLTLRTGSLTVAFDGLVSHLSQGDTVVILDAVESSLPSVASVVSDLLDASASLTFIVLSQRPLGVQDERTLWLNPLPPEASRAFLLGRVAELAPGQLLSESAIEALSRSADGLPLALDVLAASVAAVGPEAVVSQLDHSGPSAPRLETALENAWARLDPVDALVLEVLCGFRGAFDAETVRGITAAVRGPVSPAPGEAGPIGGDGTLERLRMACLVERDTAPEPNAATPFRILGAIAAHGRRRAAAAGRLESARRLHAEWHAVMAGRPLQPPGGTAPLAPALEDLVAAWEWALGEAPERVPVLALALDPRLLNEGDADLHPRVLSQSLDVWRRHGRPLPQGEACPLSATGMELDLLLALGRVYAIRARNREALAWVEEADSLAGATGDLIRRGWAAAFAAYVLRPLGRHDDAEARGTLALTIAREHREFRLMGMASISLGRLHGARGAHDLAAACFRQGLAAGTLGGIRRVEAITLANLATALDALGQRTEADHHRGLARAAFTESGDRYHLGRTAVHAANARLGHMPPAEVEEHLRAALLTVLVLGDLEGQLEARHGLVLASMARADGSLAARYFAELELAVSMVDDVGYAALIETLRPQVEALARAGTPALPLRVSRDGTTLAIGAKRLDFTRRGPLRRVLLALVTARLEAPRGIMTVRAVQDAGWPDEKMSVESGAARVYMAIRRLRDLGLEAAILTRESGYLLDPSLDVDWDGPA